MTKLAPLKAAPTVPAQPQNEATIQPVCFEETANARSVDDAGTRTSPMAICTCKDQALRVSPHPMTWMTPLRYSTALAPGCTLGISYRNIAQLSAPHWLIGCATGSPSLGALIATGWPTFGQAPLITSQCAGVTRSVTLSVAFSSPSHSTALQGATRPVDAISDWR